MNPFRVSDEGGFWRARQPAIYSAARAIKPTEVGGVAKERNHDKMAVNKGRFKIKGCPRRGDRCGDRVKRLTARLVLERNFEQYSESTTILKIVTNRRAQCVRRCSFQPINQKVF